MTRVEVAPDLRARRAYLGRQRWFVASDGPIEAIETVEWTHAPDADWAVRVELVRVRTGGGTGTRCYHVPATYRRAPFPGMESALMAHENGWFVYDAVLDAHARTALLAGFAGQHHPDLQFGTTGDLSLQHPWTRPLAAEQSNTSVVVDGRLLWKVLRIVSPGVNPEIDLGQHLLAQQASVVPRLRGWISLTEPRIDLGFVHDFVAGASDGWDVARASVRDLLHGPMVDSPADAGADFAAEAHRLGAAVATLHRHLAPLQADRLTTVSIAERLRHRFARTRAAHRFGAAAGRVFGALADLDAEVEVHRVHGDLHLGQVLRSVAGWRIFDLEGEPAADLAHRRAADHPLRDVAGMLRSLDYAPHSVLMQAGGRVDVASAWTRRNSEAFLTGYGVATDPVAWALLRCFQIDKAAYEADYERSHRPGWVGIPDAALVRLLHDEA